MPAAAPGIGDGLATTTHPTVLVVDDDPAVRAVMRAVLSSDGFDVIEAASGTARTRAISSAGRNGLTR